jgi:gliding motility-associated-like protein
VIFNDITSMTKRLQLALTLLVFCLLSFVNKAEASHAAGGELIYEWVSDSTYRFYFKFYRDCNGTTEDPSYNMCYYSACGSNSYTQILNKVVGSLPGGGVNGQEVGTGCPGYNSTCNGGPTSNPGYREWWYTGLVTLPLQCDFWTFYVDVNARNNDIDNLDNPGGQTLHVEATFNNLAAQGNSSPYFTVKPIPFMCINTPYTYNNGAVDPNNDSLSFAMIQPLNSNGFGGCQANPPVNAIAWAPGSPAYNVATNPLQTNNTFNISATTGQMTFTPSIQQTAAITLRVFEWRNGILIGTVMRDIQAVVLNCNNAPPTLNQDTATLSGAQLGPTGNVEGCAFQPMTFCVWLTSPNDTAILVATSNNATVAPGSSFTFTGMGTDSILACFSWTPQLSDSGLSILTLTVKDSTCTPPGILLSQTFSVPVFIYPITIASEDSTKCPRDTTYLFAHGGSNFNWTIQPGGDMGSLSCTNCQYPIANPASTTTYIVTSDLGNSLCDKNSDTVTINVLQTAVFSAGPDITTCIGESVQLNANVVPEPGYTYTYSWTPATYLNNPTISDPITTPVQDITYVVTVTPVGAIACPIRDTLNVKVLRGFTIFNKDSALCAGQYMQINAAGAAEYTYTWTPSIGVSNTALLNPTIAPDTSRYYTITASYPGCTDSVHTLFIDVQPVPVVFAGVDALLCYGDTINLFAAIVNAPNYPFYSYAWSPGGGLHNASVQNPNFTALTSTTLTATVTTPAGCLGSDNIFIEVISPDIVDVSSDTMLCPRDTAHLVVTGPNAVSILWSPDMYMDSVDSWTPKVWPTVTTTYAVVGTDVFNCKDTAYVEVAVHPDAVLKLADSTTIYPGQSYQIDPGGNVLYFQWFPPQGLSNASVGNPVAQPTVDTRYYVTAATENGCVTSDSIDIYVSNESIVNVPNSFIPGSNFNSTIKVERLGTATLKSFTIFNRWGAKVFESNDIDEGWDGRYKDQPQPMGVYVYMVEAVTASGKTFVKQGNITLIR